MSSLHILGSGLWENYETCLKKCTLFKSYYLCYDKDNLILLSLKIAKPNGNCNTVDNTGQTFRKPG